MRDDDFRRNLFRPRPGYTMVCLSHTGEEMRIMAQLEKEFSVSARARELKDPDADDPFWNRLCDDDVSVEGFESELLQHLGLSSHPKGTTLVSIARKNSQDLQDAYLVALDLVDLL